MLPNRECKEWNANVMHDLQFGQWVRYGAVYAPKYVKIFWIQFLVYKSKSMHFYEKFGYEIFCKKLSFEQMCLHQGSEKNFRIQFLANKSKSMHIYKKFS